METCPYCGKKFEAPDSEEIYYCTEECAIADGLTKEEIDNV